MLAHAHHPPAPSEDKGALARMVMKLFDHWQLSTEDQAGGLGPGPGNRRALSRYRQGEWEDWLRMAGLAQEARDSERMSFGSTFLSWQAAADGMGLAMGQSRLLSAEFEAGKLVRPFPLPLRRDLAYYLVRPQQQRESRKVTAFRDWLLSECAGEQSKGPAGV